jgi:hypothetical protein
LIQIKITGDRGFERIPPGKMPIFQEIALNESGELTFRAKSPKHLSPVFPLRKYMYTLKSPYSHYVTVLEKTIWSRT